MCAILRQSTQTLEYLYVPDQWFSQEWNDMEMSQQPIAMTCLKDLCVQGTRKWSLNMIRENCATLEFLFIFDYMTVEDYRNQDHIEEMEKEEYSWNDIANLNISFPKLRKLMLPQTTASNIVERLRAKCPPDVQVLTDVKMIREAFDERIKRYSNKRYNLQMSELFSKF